ncbi:hypothetical protein BH23ACT5_BH23ACT5_02300 [soil metagenome]
MRTIELEVVVEGDGKKKRFVRYCQKLWVRSWSGCDVLGVGLVGLVPFL